MIFSVVIRYYLLNSFDTFCMGNDHRRIHRSHGWGGAATEVAKLKNPTPSLEAQLPMIPS